MLVEITEIVPEVVEGVIEGVRLRVTKLHRISFCVETRFDPETRSFFVITHPATVDALVTADVIGLENRQEPGPDAEERAIQRLGLTPNTEHRVG